MNSKLKKAGIAAGVLLVLGIVGWFTYPMLTILTFAMLTLLAGSGTWRRHRRAGSAALVQRWTDRAKKHHGVADFWTILRMSSWWAMRRRARVLKPSLKHAPWLTRWSKWHTPIGDLGTKLIRSGWLWVWSSAEEHTLDFGAPRQGKALALDTSVPTPGGWTTMGDLRDGDTVYDDDGNPCRVVTAWPVLHGRDCYEVTFSDGSVIVADADHLWQVETRTGRRHRYPEKILTTADMAANVHVAGDHRANYSVRVAKPLQAPDADLPIDPYLLGCWLGDGASRGGEISKTADLFKILESDGNDLGVEQLSSTSSVSITRTIRGLRTLLRVHGLIHNKHIPAAYLRASETQRRALLAGLLDTDGYATKDGQVIFSVTDHSLAVCVRSLLATLGHRSTLSSKPARLNGKDCGTAWQVTFPHRDNVFRLPRKAARKSASTRAGWDRRYVVSIRPTTTVPVRCITVDSPNSLFLVGDQCIPTHNSGKLACHIIDAPGAVLATSTGGDLVRNTSTLRERIGPTYVFNPSNVGKVPSTVGFNVLAGCQNPQVASDRAADLIAGTPIANAKKEEEWIEFANWALSGFLHAAAIGRKTMHHVQRWVADPDTAAPEVMRILADSPEPSIGWQTLQVFNLGRPRGSVFMTIAPALRWLAEPSAVACAQGGDLDVEALLAERGTVYLLAKKDGPVAPLVTAFAGHIAREARRIADEQPSERLEPAFTIVPDEAPSICPLPLPAWSSDMGKRNIKMHIGAQSLSQLQERWGDNGAGALLTNCATLTVFGGTKDPAGLATFSTLVGSLLTPTQIREFPPLHAVVIRNGMAPIVGRPPMVWLRRDYRAAERAAVWGPRFAAIATRLGRLTRRPTPAVTRKPIAALPASAPRPDLDALLATTTGRNTPHA